MVIIVILHQHSVAGSIMGLLDLDWYSEGCWESDSLCYPTVTYFVLDYLDFNVQ